MTLEKAEEFLQKKIKDWMFCKPRQSTRSTVLADRIFICIWNGRLVIRQIPS